jgi:hypothetical protein
MIKSLTLKFFRKHEDTSIDFTRGLNVLRGPNEIGKTTITEGVLYALFGATALVDSLAEVVTWGHKEGELKAVLVICISETDYTFSRSKAGAEVTYHLSGQDVYRVTGQKEVTAFAATLLGADAKTASVLMLSSQAGLRGALDEGPTAVGALMGKLADFDTIDRLLESAANTLTLGAVAPLQTKLAIADLEVHDATKALFDPAALTLLDTEIVTLTAQHAAETTKSDDLCELVSKADSARDVATLNNSNHEAARIEVGGLSFKVNSEKQNLLLAQKAAMDRPLPETITKAREALVAAKDHATVLEAYRTYGTLGVYPAISWDKDQADFEVELAKMLVEAEAVNRATNENVAEAKALQRTLISGDGVCPTCKRAADNHDHVLTHNKGVQDAIDALAALRVPMLAKNESMFNDGADMQKVVASAKRRQAIIDKISQYLVFNVSVYPVRVEWSGPPPSETANVAGLKAHLDALEAQERAATQAEGRVTAHQQAVTALELELAVAMKAAAKITLVATQPLQDAYDEAYRVYAVQAAVARELGYTLQTRKETLASVRAEANTAKLRLEAAQARVVEYTNDIKTLEFNNELVKKLKSMKPLITDHLWNTVLAAVSNFFSVLRGEQSIVTKDASGFKVNGRGGSLSGSTLDVLALSIRVALSKTFVPHANFMILDEPAHGCDEVRTSNLLGFLAGVGFEQTILASHDELSESVADNVILLGA